MTLWGFSDLFEKQTADVGNLTASKPNHPNSIQTEDMNKILCSDLISIRLFRAMFVPFQLLYHLGATGLDRQIGPDKAYYELPGFLE
jgi:hypothetical protein